MPTSDRLDPDARPLILWCLEHLDALAEEFCAQLMLVEGYQHVDIDRREFSATARDAIGLILRRAAGMPLGRLDGVSEAIGRRRATQGVPLEVLLQGVRIAFRILWVTMHDRASASQRAALGHSVVGLWSAIEFHTVRVHAGYLDEVARMRQRQAAELTMLLSEFLDNDKPSGSVTLQVGRTLGMLPDDPVVVAAISLTDAPDARLRLSDATAHVHARHDSAIILMPGGTDPIDLQALLGDTPVAVAPTADSLSAVPRAWAIAHALLFAAPTGAQRPLTLSDGWPYLMMVLQPEITRAIVAPGIAGLHRVGADARAQLVSTVQTYMRTGSLSQTSQRLFCHRNTVLKRLSRFSSLTGLDPSNPWQAATIRLVLAGMD